MIYKKEIMNKNDDGPYLLNFMLIWLLWKKKLTFMVKIKIPIWINGDEGPSG